MNAFQVKSYKDYFKQYINLNDRKGIITQVAKYCGCDRTYFSQMLNGKIELTPDHLIQFCDSASLNAQESEYLLLLLLRDRSANLLVKNKLQGQIDKIRKNFLELSNQVVSKEQLRQTNAGDKNQYYSNWYFTAIHILSSIEEYQKLEAMCIKLQLPHKLVANTLNQLIEMGLVKKNGENYQHNGGNLFLDRNEPQITNHHLNWRIRAVNRSQISEDIHYTDVFSISKSDIDVLKKNILDMIDVNRKTVRQSGTEDCYAICIDFFNV